MRAELLGPELARVKLCVHNDSEVGPTEGDEPTRAEGLRRSLLSIAPDARGRGRGFVSPLERDGEAGEAAEACERVNTFPVLVGDGDRAVLGAAIMLPDHPELAPESLGNLFDNTEIEEALLLHVQTSYRRGAGGDRRAGPRRPRDDRAGRQGHQRRDAEPARPAHLQGARGREGSERTGPSWCRPPGLDVTPGEQELDLGPKRVRLGDKVVLRPGTEGDVFDKILHGRTATVERIYSGYDERVYLGVTIDDDPGQDLLRDTGRYLFFFADEVEVPREACRHDRPENTSEERIMLEQAAGAGRGAANSTPAWTSRSWSPGSATPGSATTASAAP